MCNYLLVFRDQYCEISGGKALFSEVCVAVMRPFASPGSYVHSVKYSGIG